MGDGRKILQRNLAPCFEFFVPCAVGHHLEGNHIVHEDWDRFLLMVSRKLFSVAQYFGVNVGPRSRKSNGNTPSEYQKTAAITWPADCITLNFFPWLIVNWRE
jgi:hypothetical protein